MAPTKVTLKKNDTIRSFKDFFVVPSSQEIDRTTISGVENEFQKLTSSHDE